MIANPQAKPHQDHGVFVALPLVNQIRQRVDAWRQGGYVGVTGISKTLLHYWNDDAQRGKRFFFCQIEAIETLIWLLEAPEFNRA